MQFSEQKASLRWPSGLFFPAPQFYSIHEMTVAKRQLTENTARSHFLFTAKPSLSEPCLSEQGRRFQLLLGVLEGLGGQTLNWGLDGAFEA
jgi:hypothetical protein